jgi:hypothetical protein
MEQNENKIFFLAIGLLLIAFLALSFSGCVPPVPEVIDVTGVDITEEDQSMMVDETLQLTAVVTPEDATNKAVTWESDNADVAAVDENGLVIALKKGVANITVLTEDGAFSDTIEITVTKPYTPSTPTIKKYEVDFQIIDAIPVGINSRNGISIDLSGFKIEIFTDAEKTTKKTDTLTYATGKASVKLPNGDYWFRVTKDGYLDYPPETFSSVQRQIQPGYFKVEGADVANIPPIPMQRTYILTMVVDPTDSGTASDDTNSGPYTAGTGVTISAEEANGYQFSSWTSTAGAFDDAGSRSTNFTMPAEDMTVTANFDKIPSYNVTVADVEGGTATVVADPNTDILKGVTVTVNISNIESGKVFSSIAVVGDDTTNPVTTTEVTAGEEYTFTMPAEDVTVTVTIETVCTSPVMNYGGSSSSDDDGYNTSSVSVPLPDNVFSTGDLALVIFATNGDMGTVAAQDGFQAIKIISGSGYPGIAAFYKILTGTDNDDFTCTLGTQNKWVARSLKITGNRNTDPIGNSSDAMINNSSTLDVPGINGASCSLLIAAAVNNEVTFNEFYPSEMDWIFNVTNNTIDLFFQISKEDRENAGNTGTRTFSLLDNNYSGDITGIMFEILSSNSAYQPGG